MFAWALAAIPAVAEASPVLRVEAGGPPGCADGSARYPIPRGTRRTSTDPFCIEAGFWASDSATNAHATTAVTPTPLRFAIPPLALAAVALAVLWVRRARARVTHLAVRVRVGGYREVAADAVQLVALPGTRVALGALHEKLADWTLELEPTRFGVLVHGDTGALEPRAQHPIGVQEGSLLLPGTVIGDGERACALLDPQSARRAQRGELRIAWPSDEGLQKAATKGPWFSLAAHAPSRSGTVIIIGAGTLLALALSLTTPFAGAWAHLLVWPAVAAAAAVGFVLLRESIRPPSGTSGPSRARPIR